MNVVEFCINESKKDKIVNFRVSERFYDFLKYEASLRGIGLSKFLMSLLIDSTERYLEKNPDAKSRI